MKTTVAIPKSRLIHETRKTPGSNIFTHEEFKALVKYERTRSDRNGSVFSVAVFHIPSKKNSAIDKTIPVISQLSRSIDCVGMGDKGQIAVLLPDTIKDGADIFGNKVIGELGKMHDGQIRFSVYSYPDNWLFADKENPPADTRHKDEPSSVRDDVEFFFVEKIPAWKRVLDICGAALLLIVASPIFLLLTLYIKLVSPGPAFFKQTRVGYKGVPFTFWKFRTMKAGNDQSFHGKHAQSFIASGDVPMEKLDKLDPRIIPGGKAIRKSCIDELPQLWNVLRGDMSLVGPRPCIPYEAHEYLRWHTHRFDVLPGLSGLWQISGKNKLTFKQMIRLDIAYCQNMSLLNDLIIIFRTPFAILKMVFEAIQKKVQERDEELAPLSLATPTKPVAQ